MSRYLAIARRHRWPGGTGSYRRLIYKGLRFECYKSRPDGVGWEWAAREERKVLDFGASDRIIEWDLGRQVGR